MTSASPEIRCPNCGRLTPLAPFCTHCGAVIPEGAGAARPRAALDRGELEARIRQQRRGSENPFLRGEPSGEPGPADAWRAPQHAAAFVPEPSDELARQEVEHAPEAQRVDYLDERGAGPGRPPQDPTSGVGGIPGAAYSTEAANWPSADREEPMSPEPPAHQPTDFGDGSGFADRGNAEEEEAHVPPAEEHRPAADYAAAASAAGYGAAAAAGYRASSDAGYAARSGPGYGSPGAYARPAEHVAPAQPDAAELPAYEADDVQGDDGDWDGRDWNRYGDEPPRRNSAALTIIGFVVLGIAALVGGALLFSVLNVPAGVARESATPTPTEQVSPSVSESAGGSASPSGGQSQGASPSAQPDNFSATTQPCATRDMGFKGCDVDGSTLDRGQVWVWVGFKNGSPDNVIGVTILSKDSNQAVADGSLTLDQLSGCNPGKTCSGYIQMVFDNLDQGDYTIQVTRDGSQVATADFSVNV